MKKYRIITQGNQFIVQVKGWVFWNNLCWGGIDAYYGIPKKFDTVEEAQEAIEDYFHRKQNDGKIVKIGEICK